MKKAALLLLIILVLTSSSAFAKKGDHLIGGGPQFLFGANLSEDGSDYPLRDVSFGFEIFWDYHLAKNFSLGPELDMQFWRARGGDAHELLTLGLALTPLVSFGPGDFITLHAKFIVGFSNAFIEGQNTRVGCKLNVLPGIRIKILKLIVFAEGGYQGTFMTEKTIARTAIVRFGMGFQF